jgi:hypothetical protein
MIPIHDPSNWGTHFCKFAHYEAVQSNNPSSSKCVPQIPMFLYTKRIISYHICFKGAKCVGATMERTFSSWMPRGWLVDARAFSLLTTKFSTDFLPFFFFFWFGSTARNCSTHAQDSHVSCYTVYVTLCCHPV